MYSFFCDGEKVIFERLNVNKYRLKHNILFGKNMFWILEMIHGYFLHIFQCLEVTSCDIPRYVVAEICPRINILGLLPTLVIRAFLIISGH